MPDFNCSLTWILVSLLTLNLKKYPVINTLLLIFNVYLCTLFLGRLHETAKDYKVYY